MSKRAIIFVMVVTMVFSFCIAPPANAIVPTLAWVVWAIAAGATGAAAVADHTGDQEQAQAKNQGQEAPKAIHDTASELEQSPG
jgi:heme O synthase-like polyprenyltransferase